MGRCVWLFMLMGGWAVSFISFFFSFRFFLGSEIFRCCFFLGGGFLWGGEERRGEGEVVDGKMEWGIS